MGIDWQERSHAHILSLGDIKLSLFKDDGGYSVEISAEEEPMPLQQRDEKSAKIAALDIAIHSLKVALRDCERVRRSSDGGA